MPSERLEAAESVGFVGVFSLYSRLLQMLRLRSAQHDAAPIIFAGAAGFSDSNTPKTTDLNLNPSPRP